VVSRLVPAAREQNEQRERAAAAQAPL